MKSFLPSLPAARTLAIAVLGLVLVGSPADAQTLEDVREELRRALEAAHFGQTIVALVDLTNEQELAASRYLIDDEQGTSINVISLPWRTAIPLEEEGAEAIYIEANLGYLKATGQREDLFGAEDPEDANGYRARWKALGGLAGVGYRLPVTEEFTLTPILDLSLLYMENEASYTGPDASVVGSLLDGILFNWNATTMGVGGALRADWKSRFSELVDFELIGRYDFRHFETLHSTDQAQEISELSHFLTGKLRVSGPLGISVANNPLGWRADLGYRRYTGQTAQALEFTDFIELGGALDVQLREVPVLSSLTLSGSLLYGHDVTGWTLGLGASF